MKTASINVRIDEAIKLDLDEIFEELGLTLSDAVRVFLRKAWRSHGFPFDVRLEPSAEVLETIAEANAIASGAIPSKAYKSAKELFDDLDREILQEEASENSLC
jgi:DNA-damage-inducible protein J